MFIMTPPSPPSSGDLSPENPPETEIPDPSIHTANSYSPPSSSMENDRHAIVMDNFKGMVFKLAIASSSTKSLSPQLRSLIEQRLEEFFPVFPTPDHPPYSSMIQAAMQTLDEEGASSEEAISQFIRKEYPNLPWAHDTLLKHHLKNLCKDRRIAEVSSGFYMLRGSVTGLDSEPSPCSSFDSYSIFGLSPSGSPSSGSLSSSSYCSSPRVKKRGRKKGSKNKRSNKGKVNRVRPVQVPKGRQQRPSRKNVSEDETEISAEDLMLEKESDESEEQKSTEEFSEGAECINQVRGKRRKIKKHGQGQETDFAVDIKVDKPSEVIEEAQNEVVTGLQQEGEAEEGEQENLLKEGTREVAGQENCQVMEEGNLPKKPHFQEMKEQSRVEGDDIVSEQEQRNKKRKSPLKNKGIKGRKPNPKPTCVRGGKPRGRPRKNVLSAEKTQPVEQQMQTDTGDPMLEDETEVPEEQCKINKESAEVVEDHGRVQGHMHENLEPSRAEDNNTASEIGKSGSVGEVIKLLKHCNSLMEADSEKNKGVERCNKKERHENFEGINEEKCQLEEDNIVPGQDQRNVQKRKGRPLKKSVKRKKVDPEPKYISGKARGRPRKKDIGQSVLALPVSRLGAEGMSGEKTQPNEQEMKKTDCQDLKTTQMPGKARGRPRKKFSSVENTQPNEVQIGEHSMMPEQDGSNGQKMKGQPRKRRGKQMGTTGSQDHMSKEKTEVLERKKKNKKKLTEAVEEHNQTEGNMHETVQGSPTEETEMVKEIGKFGRVSKAKKPRKKSNLVMAKQPQNDKVAEGFDQQKLDEETIFQYIRKWYPNFVWSGEKNQLEKLDIVSKQDRRIEQNRKGQLLTRDANSIRIYLKYPRVPGRGMGGPRRRKKAFVVEKTEAPANEIETADMQDPTFEENCILNKECSEVAEDGSELKGNVTDTSECIQVEKTQMVEEVRNPGPVADDNLRVKQHGSLVEGEQQKDLLVKGFDEQEEHENAFDKEKKHSERGKNETLECIQAEKTQMVEKVGKLGPVAEENLRVKQHSFLVEDLAVKGFNAQKVHENAFDEEKNQSERGKNEMTLVENQPEGQEEEQNQQLENYVESVAEKEVGVPEMDVHNTRIQENVQQEGQHESITKPSLAFDVAERCMESGAIILPKESLDSGLEEGNENSNKNMEQQREIPREEEVSAIDIGDPMEVDEAEVPEEQCKINKELSEVVEDVQGNMQETIEPSRAEDTHSVSGIGKSGSVGEADELIKQRSFWTEIDSQKIKAVEEFNEQNQPKGQDDEEQNVKSVAEKEVGVPEMDGHNTRIQENIQQEGYVDVAERCMESKAIVLPDESFGSVLEEGNENSNKSMEQQLKIYREEENVSEISGGEMEVLVNKPESSTAGDSQLKLVERSSQPQHAEDKPQDIKKPKNVEPRRSIRLRCRP